MPWLGTFHSIGVKILRRHAEMVGLRSDFTILDTDDQIRLLKQIVLAAGIDEKRWPARQLAGAIDGWKNRGLAPDKIPTASLRLRQRQGPRALRRLSGAAEDAERRRFRRPPDRVPAPLP
jgi:DNA helicase-2/ATP-dependent DNA helicase PcrA